MHTHKLLISFQQVNVPFQETIKVTVMSVLKHDQQHTSPDNDSIHLYIQNLFSQTMFVKSCHLWSAKGLQTTPLCYSNATSTLTVLLTSIRLVKTKHEDFNFVHFSFFFYSIMAYSKTIWCVRMLCIPKVCSANGDHSYLFSALCELRLATYGLKPVSNIFVLILTLFGLVTIPVIAWVWHIWLVSLYLDDEVWINARPNAWLNVCVTDCDEFATAVSRILFIIFDLVYILETRLNRKIKLLLLWGVACMEMSK